MRVLIACDALSSPERLYGDLKRAGFPKDTRVLVLSVANIIPASGYKNPKTGRLSADMALAVRDTHRAIHKAQMIAIGVVKKLSSRFPCWSFDAKGLAGSPAREIHATALKWKADLIMVGSHDRSGVESFFFGSVVQKVLTESLCSVRVVRESALEVDTPARIVVGLDGSSAASRAINVMRSRSWNEATSIRLVTAVDTGVMLAPSANSSIRKKWASNKSAVSMEWVKRMHKEYQDVLSKKGLRVSSVVKRGDPKIVLIEEAARWGAESIILGATGHGFFERVFIGSVSLSVASRAHCSVEIIRSGR